MAMETSAASSVPQELFDLILDFHQVDEGHHTQHDHDLRNYATVEKHDLGQLSLVCRHWGQICQRKIFETIRLGSWADVHELQALLDAPASRISRYILHLEISAQDGPGEPWLHLIAFLWPRLYAIEQYVGLTLSLKNTRPTRCSSMRSIHAALPRSQPVFSSRITHLTLTDISFRQIADLMHLVGEMSDLVDVDCIRLTWGVPERLPQRQMGRGYSNLTVRMSDCTSLWPAIWIAAGVTQRSRCNLLPEDLVCMGHLAKAIETGVDRKKWPQPSSFAISHSRDINAVPFASRFEIRDHFNGLIRMPALHFTTSSTLQTTSDFARLSRIPLHLDFVSLTFRVHDVTVGDAVLCDWGLFDETAARLTGASHFNVGFATRAEMDQFMETVVNLQLPRTSFLRTDKIQYAVYDKDRSRWKYACSKAESVLEGLDSGESQLWRLKRHLPSPH